MSARLPSDISQRYLTLSAEYRKGTDTAVSVAGGSVRCHRCGESMTLYVVGDDYCQPCKRERAERERQDARRVVRFGVAKELSPWGGAA